MAQNEDVRDLVNLWLKIVSVQRIKDCSFIQSMFLILKRASGKQEDHNPLQADIESINLLSEIRYQLLDKQDHALGHAFFKCLMQSADFWINQSLVGDNNQMVNEQYWLLVKTIYAYDPELYNSLFPAHILIALMNELASVHSQEAGSPQNCCEYHSANSRLLGHQALTHRKQKRIPDEPHSAHDFEVVEMPAEHQAVVKQMQASVQQTTLFGPAMKAPLFFSREQCRITEVKSLLQPITAVLESVMNASFNSQQSHELPSEILDLLKHIA